MALRTYAVLARVSPGYPPLQGRLSTCYSPVRRFTNRPKSTFSLDLHVLSTPPAFILSQDQTLQLKILTAIDRLRIDSDAFEIKNPTSSPKGNVVGGVNVVASPLFSFQRTDSPVRAIFKSIPAGGYCQSRSIDPRRAVKKFGGPRKLVRLKSKKIPIGQLPPTGRRNCSPTFGLCQHPLEKYLPGPIQEKITRLPLTFQRSVSKIRRASG